MPLPFLVLVISTDLKLLSSIKSNLFDVIIIVCCVCYFIQAFYISFLAILLV